MTYHYKGELFFRLPIPIIFERCWAFTILATYKRQFLQLSISMNLMRLSFFMLEKEEHSDYKPANMA